MLLVCELRSASEIRFSWLCGSDVGNVCAVIWNAKPVLQM